MRGLIEWLVDHATTVFLAVLCLFVAGMAAYVGLPRESNPDITIPVVLVSTPYIGVAPEDVEGLITIPMENELAGLRDVKVMKSTSAEGVSIISIEFEPDVVIQDALQKVRDAVAKAKPRLPADAEEPSVSEISFADIPIVLITLAGEVDESTLKKLADKLEEGATRIPGVLDANVTGGVDREIAVQVIPERLAHYGLALYDVANAIRDENVNIPGGTVSSGGSTVLMRVPGEFHNVEEIEAVAIKRVGDQPVFVRDVARVRDGNAERKTYSRMNGRPSITLSVSKRAGANILEVAQAVKDLAAEQSKTWPAGVTYRVLGDQSEGIEISVTDLENNIITALILVVGVIVFVMGIRNALFVAIAIPLSMFLSFLALDLLGFTLNMVVLFSLMIALGMLVDNAIVVVENVYRHREMGSSNHEAAIEGTREVAIAVGASTLTTLAAFFPMVFWPGIMGEFMGFLPKTVIIVLTASFVVAIAVLPVAMNRWLAPKIPKSDTDATDPGEPELGRIMSAYKALLLLSIRFRYVSFGLGVGVLLFTVAAFSVLNHGVEMFPETEPERANIFVRTGEGTDLDTTDQVVRRIEGILSTADNVDVWVAETGVASDGNALGPSSSANNQARITVDFLPSVNTAGPGEKVRVEETSITIDRLRKQLIEIPGAEIRIEKEMMGPPVGKPIGVEVRGPDFHGVGELAMEVRRAIRDLEGVADLSDDYRVGRPELPLRIDRGAAKRVGISTSGIGDTVRTVVAGTKASALRDGEDEYDIMVRLAPEYRSDLQSVLSLRLPGREDTSPDTFAVPLSSVASYSLTGGTGAIKHIDQDLVVTIEGDVQEGVNSVEMQKTVAKLIDGYKRPEGYHLQLGGSTDEQEEAAAFLTNAFLVAVALIMLVLVTQFDSIALPLIILVTVILSLIGVLWGLVIMGMPFGIIMTGIGVISLAGVVVNNAIVLLDYVQQLEQKGDMSVQDSLVMAGITRFRPVMLTAVTTTLGLVPMAAGISVDFLRFRLVFGSVSAQMWGPMAVAVIFGLSFATVLTLVMVPTLYSIYDDFRKFGARLQKNKVATAAVAGVLLLVLLPGPAQAASLQDCVVAARSHAPGMRISREQTDAAGLQRYEAWTSLSPRVAVNASRVINEFAIELDFADTFPEIPGVEIPPSEPTIVQRKAFWTADVTVSQRLFSGSAFPALRAAYSSYDAARLAAQQTESDLEVQVASAYYGVLLAREAEAVALAALDASKGQLDRADRQLEAGFTTRRSVLSATLTVASGERDLLRAQEQRIRAEESLALLTGIAPDTMLELPAPVPIPSSIDEAVAGIDSRADLRGLEAQERSALQARSAARAQWLPVVDAQFKYAYNQNTGFQNDPTAWTIAVAGTWSLWDGGSRMVQSAQYASQARLAAIQRDTRRDQAGTDVRVAWETYQTAQRALTAVEDENALADENARLATEAYEVGNSTWLEIRESQVLLASARLNAIEQRMNRDLAALRLRSAAGLPVLP